MITDVVLNVVDNGTLRDPAERYDIADGERGAAAVVVFGVEVVNECNRLSCGWSPHGNSFLYL